MTPQEWKQVKSLFNELCRRPPGEWPQSLGRACGAQPKIRRQVEEMLREWAGEQAPQQGAWKGRRIGRFTILREIGRGGMGIVYLAEQRDPVRRRVALKVVRQGMADRQAASRLKAERQTLALMNHPCIAQVFDAGATSERHPYFVMEHVEGTPIVQYCDERRLSVRQRLRLFLQVCQAIQHAHQKGVIHRDIKPSNLLVEERDGRPFPKVIDFGVAKAFEMPEAQDGLLTLPGVQVGTPAYMSPEQALMPGAVDTRSDIYSLGVVLYELLTGALPFEPGRLRRNGLQGMRRILGQQEPPRPSQRLGGMGEQALESARRRQRELPALIRELRGDLDWIAMKALEKSPQRRYASVSELSADIVRCLENRPVAAGPPRASYRLRKFVLRHKLGVAVTLALTAALMAGIAGTALALLRALRAEQAAVQEARRTEQATEFLQGMFELSDPDPGRGKTITAREILDQGAAKVGQGVPADPLLRSEVMHSLGLFYKRLMLYQEARSLLEEALKIRLNLLGERHLKVADSLADLGRLNWLTAKRRYGKLQHFFERSLAIYQSQLGDHPKVAETLVDLALVHWKSDQPEKALAALRRAVAIRERIPQAGPGFAEELNSLALLQTQTGDRQAAQESYLRLLSIREETLGPDHPLIADTLDRLGNLDRRAGNFQSAQSLYERALSIREKSLEADHPHLALSLENLGLVRHRRGDAKGAAALFERAYSLRLKDLPSEAAQPGRDRPQPALDVADYEKRQLDVEQRLRIRGEKLSPNPAFTPNDLALIVTAPAYGQLALPPGFKVEVIDREPRAAPYYSRLAVNPKTGNVYYTMGRSLRRFEAADGRVTELGDVLLSGLAIHPQTQQLVVQRPRNRSPQNEFRSMEFLAVDESAAPATFRAITPVLPVNALDFVIDPAGIIYFSVPPSQGDKGVYRYEGGSRIIALTTDLTAPTGLALAPDGDLYVCDSLADALFRIPAEGGDPVLLGNLDGLFANPIAQDPASGDFYVGIATWYGAGASLGRLTPQGGSYSSFAFGFHEGMSGIGFDRQGNLYVLVGGSPAILYRISGFQRPSPSKAAEAIHHARDIQDCPQCSR